MTTNSLARQMQARAPARRTQRGAALFVALMILILLSLLALSASQVTALQERMAGAYRADALAFNNSEREVREMERSLLTNLLVCDANVAALPTSWSDGSEDETQQFMENLSGRGGRGLEVSGSVNAGASCEPGGLCCSIIRVSAFAQDNDAAPTSTAVVQTIYSP